MTAKRFAVQMTVNGEPTEHVIADPPVGFGTNDIIEYSDSIRDVIRMGGVQALNTTNRRPDQTAGAYFWAYDGANLIGTPPRLYNQILRKVAFGRKPGSATSEATNADFARLFALANVAMADAGIFCWREKYCFEFWRPLSGVRNENSPLGDPFWLSLGAPETNSNEIPFVPPFPSYPSGHATFGAAIFQIARLYYKKRDNLSFALDEPDDICFSFVSDELNGINRDLNQPYNAGEPITNQPGTVRTRVNRHFPSLWAAIFDNAISRIWFGIHWRFDAFAAQDALVMCSNPEMPYTVNPDGTTAYRDPDTIRYQTTGPRSDRPGQFPIGGVPLGIGIANDVFCGNLTPTPSEKQPDGRDKCGSTLDYILVAT
jgi:vanadium chloroperoxidase